jgi:hypothetical protein
MRHRRDEANIRLRDSRVNLVLELGTLTAERADGGQRTAVLAVEFVDSIAVNDQFPLVVARQVQIARQAIARILVIAVACVVHTGQFVAEISRVVLARITPSSVGHRASLR